MGNSLEDLKETMRSKADEELYLLLRVHSQDYTPEAIEAASEEFTHRQLDGPTMNRIVAVAEKALEERDGKPGGSDRKPAHGRWNWVWPNVDTQSGAAWAMKQAFWAAVLVAVVTSGFALLGAVGVAFVRASGFDAWALVDGIIFGAIAVGLWMHSRVAAWAGLVLYGAERAYMWSTIGVKNPVIAGIFILAFIGGIRGTSAMHRLERAKPEQGEHANSC